MKNDRGFALAALMIFMMALSILMAVAVPAYRMQAQRELEEELIFRGQEYVRAIQKFQRRFGIYPPSIDALMETNGLRFLRRQYTDPVTGEGFRLLTINPDGSINGSTLYQQRAGNAPLFQGGTPQMFGQPGFGQGGPAQQQGGGGRGGPGQGPQGRGGSGQGSQGGFGGAQAGAGGFGGFGSQAPGGGPGGSGRGGGFGQQPGIGAPTSQGTFETGSLAGAGQQQGVGTPGGFGQQSGFGSAGGFGQRGGGGGQGRGRQGRGGPQGRGGQQVGGGFGQQGLTGGAGFGQQQAGVGGQQQAMASSGIVGVAPENEDPSLKAYNNREKYNEWEFIAMPGFGTIPVPPTGAQAQGAPTGQPNPFQQNQSSPFSGTQPNPFQGSPTTPLPTDTPQGTPNYSPGQTRPPGPGGGP